MITFDPWLPGLKGSKKAISFLLIYSTGSMRPGNRQTKSGGGIKAKHHNKKVQSRGYATRDTETGEIKQVIKKNLVLFSLWNSPPFWHKIMESRWLIEAQEVLNMLCYILTERIIWFWNVWIWSPSILISAVSKFDSQPTMIMNPMAKQLTAGKHTLGVISDYRFTVCWTTVRQSFVLIRNLFRFSTYICICICLTVCKYKYSF